MGKWKELAMEQEEKEWEIQQKANGLSASTKFYEEKVGRDTMEYHEHPETGELVILRTWWVADGEDDVMPEFEVETVFSKEVCEESKKNHAK